MNHEENLELAFQKVVEQVNQYDSFQKLNPNFGPDREKTWKAIPTPL